MERVARDESEMEALGVEIAAGLAAGAVLALVGGLGAGKTRFVKGLARGLGFPGEVTSPTSAVRPRSAPQPAASNRQEPMAKASG